MRLSGACQLASSAQEAGTKAMPLGPAVKTRQHRPWTFRALPQPSGLPSSLRQQEPSASLFCLCIIDIVRHHFTCVKMRLSTAGVNSDTPCMQRSGTLRAWGAPNNTSTTMPTHAVAETAVDLTTCGVKPSRYLRRNTAGHEVGQNATPVPAAPCIPVSVHLLCIPDTFQPENPSISCATNACLSHLTLWTMHTQTDNWLASRRASASAERSCDSSDNEHAKSFERTK